MVSTINSFTVFTDTHMEPQRSLAVENCIGGPTGIKFVGSASYFFRLFVAEEK